MQSDKDRPIGALYPRLVQTSFIQQNHTMLLGVRDNTLGNKATYSERLCRLGYADTLELRRLKSDLIIMFKIISNCY